MIAVTTKNETRAIPYRQLALTENDRAKAALLLKLANEADRNVLCTSDRPSYLSEELRLKSLQQDR